MIDGSYGNVSLDGASLDFDAWSLAGHLWWDFGSWRLGGVVAAADGEADAPFEFNEMAYGIEGTWDLGPTVVLRSSITHGDGEFAGVLDYETFNWDTGVNFYATPNVRLGGFVGTGNAEIDGVGDADSLSFGLNGEFQPFWPPKPSPPNPNAPSPCQPSESALPRRTSDSPVKYSAPR